MQRLNQASLATLPANITAPKYAPVTVSSGILHFGVGNFHRAHQAMYCDELLNKGELKWGITGVSLRSPDMRDHLAAQDYLYTQATLGEQTQYKVVGALQHILVAPEDPQAVLSEVANSNIQLITMTITEKGYDLANGELNGTASGVAHDLLDL
ncbi:MAG: mannitol dehydrogenase family protein, partial [Glaciecola sp.]|nr:mannitol dehydrogenase family protein [Glaciecola sp.]